MFRAVRCKLSKGWEHSSCYIAVCFYHIQLFLSLMFDVLYADFPYLLLLFLCIKRVYLCNINVLIE